MLVIEFWILTELVCLVIRLHGICVHQVQLKTRK